MNSESTCTLVLTRQMVEDLSRAAVIDYPSDLLTEIGQ